MPIAFLLPLLAGSSAASSEARAAEHSCHWVEGRLQGGNGTPAYRIRGGGRGGCSG
ncbi:MAG TPA: hypothetical protein VD887_12675 [Allosphingosinicella sp.]|nr:hypothetical protein [Allosphingosinicella sp.]